jgi:inositol-1,3,4-trisphosphate 5/6-kinase/inositol-tetrakisphosphate 1-kinase
LIQFLLISFHSFLVFLAGGVLFKVFVVGDSMRVVRRFSLPDVDLKVGNNGVMPFPRVSNAAATAENADLDPEVAGKFT